jgi:hypothetical protein
VLIDANLEGCEECPEDVCDWYRGLAALSVGFGGPVQLVTEQDEYGVNVRVQFCVRRKREISRRRMPCKQSEDEDEHKAGSQGESEEWTA